MSIITNLDTARLNGVAMRFISSVVVALTLFCSAAAQSVSVGGNYPASKVAEAKAFIAASEPKQLKLNPVDFEVIVPSKDARPLQFFKMSNSCIEVVEVMPGETVVFPGVRRGDNVFKVHRFKAEAYRWAIVYAKSKGIGEVIINRNGADPAKDAPEEVERVIVTVGDAQPEPPGPGPEPKPPTPADTWSKDGLRVLLLFETGNNTMTPAQFAAVNSTFTRDYLSKKSVKVNGQSEWRYWDKDTDISRESAIWKDGFERWKKAGSKVPFLLISNGKDADYAGDIPENLDKLAELLKKYGGN